MGVQAHRLKNFDFVRLLAAFLVFFSHQQALSGRDEISVIDAQSLGGVGVMMFFTISGFLIARCWTHDPHLGRFAAKRLLRIWPAYAAVILLTVFVLGPAVTSLPARQYFDEAGTWQYLRNLLFEEHRRLPGVFETNLYPFVVNGSLWTIAFELMCYVLLAAAGLLGLMRSRWALEVLMLTLVVAYAGLDTRGETVRAVFDLGHTGSYLYEFSLYFFGGACYYRAGIAQRRQLALRLVLVAWPLSVLAFLAFRLQLSLWLALVPTVLWVGTASWPVLRRMGRYGDFSYGIYLYAFPVQQTLISLLHERMAWWPMLVAVLSVVVLCGYLSWHLLEKRLLQLKPQQRLQSHPA